MHRPRRGCSAGEGETARLPAMFLLFGLIADEPPRIQDLCWSLLLATGPSRSNSSQPAPVSPHRRIGKRPHLLSFFPAAFLLAANPDDRTRHGGARRERADRRLKM